MRYSEFEFKECRCDFIWISYLFPMLQSGKEVLVSIHLSSVWKTFQPFLCTFVKSYLSFKHFGIGSIHYLFHKLLTLIPKENLLSCKWKVRVLVAQSCMTLCDPVDCSLSGSSVHVILQARVLEWVAIPCSKGSSQPRDQTRVSCFAGRFFTI